jgi:hypothetical protein
MASRQPPTARTGQVADVDARTNSRTIVPGLGEACAERMVLWELTYPESHMRGGSPPRLESYPIDEVRANYPDITFD